MGDSLEIQREIGDYGIYKSNFDDIRKGRSGRRKSVVVHVQFLIVKHEIKKNPSTGEFDTSFTYKIDDDFLAMDGEADEITDHEKMKIAREIFEDYSFGLLNFPKDCNEIYIDTYVVDDRTGEILYVVDSDVVVRSF